MEAYKLILSVYAAVVSTVVFVWRIYEFYFDRVGKLNLAMEHRFKVFIPPNSFGSSYDFPNERYLNLRIVNTGRSKMYISNILLKTDNGLGEKKFVAFSSLNKIQPLPLQLEANQPYDYEIPYAPIPDLKAKGIKRVKALVIDSNGKQYSTKWFGL